MGLSNSSSFFNFADKALTSPLRDFRNFQNFFETQKQKKGCVSALLMHQDLMRQAP